MAASPLHPGGTDRTQSSQDAEKPGRRAQRGVATAGMADLVLERGRGREARQQRSAGRSPNLAYPKLSSGCKRVNQILDLQGSSMLTSASVIALPPVEVPG